MRGYYALLSLLYQWHIMQTGQPICHTKPGDWEQGHYESNKQLYS